MELTRNTGTIELINFLKRDYANNLYFFTYIDEISGHEPDVTVYAARKEGAIVLAVLVSPTHCCISAAENALIEMIARQLPSVESTHILGRSDITIKFLEKVQGPVRKKKLYSFCRLDPQGLPRQQYFRSIKASQADLPDLIRFYQGNDMLVNCKTRLKSILNWGTAYFIREGGEVVSCALTTTETGDMAMIGAIFTSEAQRNRGFARDCMINLYRDLLGKRKGIYLFHESEDLILERMYKNMGFGKIDTWVVATKY